MCCIGKWLRLIEECPDLDARDSPFPYELLYEIKIDELIKLLDENSSEGGVRDSRVYLYLRFHLDRVSTLLKTKI